jgi:hypothetical protein
MRQENRDAAVELANQDRQPGNVVRMLVGDQDGVEIGRVFADGCQTCGELPRAEARIDQDARPISSYKCRVTGAGRSQ